MIPNLYKRLIIPKEYNRSPIKRKEAEYIYCFLKEKGITKTLETGFAFGCSTAYIIAAAKHKHYAIDPFQKAYRKIGLENIKRLGLLKYLEFKNDFSYNALPQLLKEGVKIDFAFIDGSHKFDDAFIDFYYIDLLLNEKGYVLFHDNWLGSVHAVISWIKNNKANYKRIRTPCWNLVMFQKIGQDKRKWHRFKPFSTGTSFLNIFFNIRALVSRAIHNLK